MISHATKETPQIRAIKGFMTWSGTYLNSERKLDGDHTRENADKNDEMLLFWA